MSWNINFERTIQLESKPVTLAFCADVIRASETCHGSTEVRVGLDDLEAGSAEDNLVLWEAAERWVQANEPELEREALERYRMQEEVWA